MRGPCLWPNRPAAVRPGYLAGYVPADGQRTALGGAVPAWPPKCLPARRAAFAADAFVDCGAQHRTDRTVGNRCTGVARAGVFGLVEQRSGRSVQVTENSAAPLAERAIRPRRHSR